MDAGGITITQIHKNIQVSDSSCTSVQKDTMVHTDTILTM